MILNYVINISHNSMYIKLENFYNKLCDGHKAFIIEYWKRKLLAKSPDPKFKDMRKIEALNRISHGAM